MSVLRLPSTCATSILPRRRVRARTAACRPVPAFAAGAARTHAGIAFVPQRASITAPVGAIARPLEGRRGPRCDLDPWHFRHYRSKRWQAQRYVVHGAGRANADHNVAAASVSCAGGNRATHAPHAHCANAANSPASIARKRTLAAQQRPLRAPHRTASAVAPDQLPATGQFAWIGAGLVRRRSPPSRPARVYADSRGEVRILIEAEQIRNPA
jgi:hypothetical protein